jgi:ferredoxin
MRAVVDKIRQRAFELLASGQVGMVLGYTQGSLPMTTRPFAARRPDQAAQLWWDEFCVMNLAAFVPHGGAGRIAVVAKGCDYRSLAVHHHEGRIDLKRDVIVLGVPCGGMLDARRIGQAVGGGEAVCSVHVSGDEVAVRVLDSDITLSRGEVLREACAQCLHRNPVAADEWMDAPTPGDPGGRSESPCARPGDPEPHAGSADLRALFSACIFCFACRQACPLCYCRSCFADTFKPLWLGGAAGNADVLDFHFQRAFHLAGRCTGCGACESACPVGIPVRILARRVSREIERKHGFEAGVNLAEPPPEVLFHPEWHELQGRSRPPSAA